MARLIMPTHESLVWLAAAGVAAAVVLLVGRRLFSTAGRERRRRNRSYGRVTSRRGKPAVTLNAKTKRDGK